MPPCCRRNDRMMRQIFRKSLISKAWQSTRSGILPPMTVSAPPAGFEHVLLLESGVGTDQHGQSVTKACIRACKDAISFNSVPNLEELCGGRDKSKLKLQLAVPFDDGNPPEIDLEQIKQQFVNGHIVEPIEIIHGGARFGSMCALPSLGDKDSSWVFAIALVTIGS